jgi:hypothetical protein
MEDASMIVTVHQRKSAWAMIHFFTILASVEINNKNKFVITESIIYG